MADPKFKARSGLFGELPLPYWYCQPYERPSPEDEVRNKEKRELLTRPLTIEELVQEQGISKRKVKKRLRNPNKNFDAKKKIKFEICEQSQCNNPRGQKCNFSLCKSCCRTKTSKEVVDCIGHKIHFTTHPALKERNRIIDNKDSQDNCDDTTTGNDITNIGSDITRNCDSKNICDTNDKLNSDNTDS